MREEEDRVVARVEVDRVPKTSCLGVEMSVPCWNLVKAPLMPMICINMHKYAIAWSVWAWHLHVG